MKNFRLELMNRLFCNLINRLVWWFDKCWIHFPFSLVFYLKKTSGKTSSWITTVCATFCWEESLYYITRTVFILLSGASISFSSFEHLFCFLRLLYLSTRFLSLFLARESTLILNLLPSFRLFFVHFRMSWMLVTVNKLRLMACHVPHAPRTTS